MTFELSMPTNDWFVAQLGASMGYGPVLVESISLKAEDEDV